MSQSRSQHQIPHRYSIVFIIGANIATTPTLEIERFVLDRWRGTIKKSSHIYDTIWSKIVSIKDKHAMKQICRELRLIHT